ncbi:MAG: M1 family metallopeptidase [Gammaproteobacteria bacterium]|nr:M1 family metallopeptidase [Gammaproteobacteria bacterium]
MKTKTRILLGAACAVALAPLATQAAEQFDFDKAPGRLPKNVVPVDYDIAVVPDIKAKTLTGTESVSLNFRESSDKIVFNTLNLKLNHVRLDGKAVKNVATDNDKQVTTVTLAAPAAAGTHKLTLAYTGEMETRPQGMFVQPYGKSGNNSGGVMLSTQMESTDARRMFPCWDEPAFRATFRLTATVPAAWATISNMPVAKRTVHGALATTSFRRSPKMPTYLVEFTAGDMKEISAQGPHVRFGVWAVSGREEEGRAALANAQQIIADYDDYFGYAFPLPKLDSIAIPGGFSGAMENWGAITYTDAALLLSPASSITQTQTAYSTQAHEIAHQWNGDLVTMGWWDDLWLNESFASWMAAKETARRNPGWKWWEREDVNKENAMEADARVSSHPIQVHVTDELQAANAFDPSITYNKGEAVLRMLEAYLGPDTFRAGIRAYIKAHAFGNATTADLWNGLSSASHQDVGTLAAGWIEQAGFPLVSVTVQCSAAGERTLSLSQKRFFLTAPADTAPQVGRWRVPLQVRSGAQGTPRAVLLTDDGQTVPAGSCQEPLSVDADAIGYYRVQYDPRTLAVNTHAFDTLSDGDRIALLDDQWALVQSQAAPLSSYLALAENMGNDLDTRPWQQITDALGVIEYDERSTAGHDAFAAYARSILDPLAQRLGWDAKPGETPDLQTLRRQVIESLGVLGDSEVIAEARRRFAGFVKDQSSIAPDDQAMVLNIVGLHADVATFEQLHTLAKATADDAEQRRLYLALAGVRDPKLAEQAAAIALSPELPPQAIQLRLGMVGTLRQEHPQLGWTTFSGHAEMLMSPFGNMAPLFIAQFVPQFFWNSLPPEQMESWIRAHVPAEMNDYIQKGMESARFQYSQKQLLVPAADSYVMQRVAHTPSA